MRLAGECVVRHVSMLMIRLLCVVVAYRVGTWLSKEELWLLSVAIFGGEFRLALGLCRTSVR